MNSSRTNGAALPDPALAIFRYFPSVMIGLLFSFARPGPLPSQGPVERTIPPRKACGRCVIGVTQVFRLESSPARFDLGVDQAATLDSRGWYYFVPEHDLTAILLADPRGSVVRRFGRDGAGPGEFRRIHHMAIGPADSLYVWDVELRRISVLSPAPDPKVIRTFPLKASLDIGGFHVLGDGRILANADVGHTAAFGQPLHLFDPSGKYLRSFGALEAVFRRGDPLGLARLVAPVQAGVWTVRANEYLLELWDANGSRKAMLRRDADWFRPYARQTISEAEAPKPIPVGITTLPEGLLAVVVLVPDHQWRRGLVRRSGSHGTHDDIADYNRTFDTVIEVIDPGSGELLQSKRVDRFFRRFVSPQRLSGYDESPSAGTQFPSVWQLTFQRAAEPAATRRPP